MTDNLPKEERDYEAKAAQREEERLRKQEALKKEAIAKAISGASGQVSSVLGTHGSSSAACSVNTGR